MPVNSMAERARCALTRDICSRYFGISHAKQAKESAEAGAQSRPALLHTLGMTGVGASLHSAATFPLREIGVRRKTGGEKMN